MNDTITSSMPKIICFLLVVLSPITIVESEKFTTSKSMFPKGDGNAFEHSERFEFLSASGQSTFSNPENPAFDFDLLRNSVAGALDIAAKQGFRFALVDYKASALDVINRPDKYNAVVVVVAQGGPPSRRTALQPFLRAEPPSLLPVGVVNKAAAALEAVLGRRLYAYTVKLANFNRQQAPASGWPGAYAVFDVSSGEILVDSEAVHESWTSKAAQGAMSRAVGPLFDFMAQKTKLVGESGVRVTRVLELIREYWPALMGVAMVSKVPLWFCALCPAILGLALPLLINLGLGALANDVCNHFHMPDDQCLDMWYGAFALGFLLSMASAIPIFYVCRLYQCEHPDARTVVATLSNSIRRRLRL